MSATTERGVIGKMFSDGWGNRTRVSWPNDKFEPQPGEAFVRFSIMQADTEQIEIGGVRNMVRAVGRVFLLVHVPKHTGDAVARGHADAIAALFDANKELTTPAGDGRFLFRKATTREIGAGDTHYLMNVSVPYLYDTL